MEKDHLVEEEKKDKVESEKPEEGVTVPKVESNDDIHQTDTPKVDSTTSEGKLKDPVAVERPSINSTNTSSSGGFGNTVNDLSQPSTRPVTTAETSTNSNVPWDGNQANRNLNSQSYDLRVHLLKSLGIEDISRIDIADNKLLERFFSLHIEREQKEIEKLKTKNLEKLELIVDKFVSNEKFTNDTLNKLLELISSKSIDSHDLLGSSSIQLKRTEHSPNRLMSPRGHKRYKSEIPTVPETQYSHINYNIHGQPVNMVYHQAYQQVTPQTYYVPQGNQAWHQGSYTQGNRATFQPPSLANSNINNSEDVKLQEGVKVEPSGRARQRSSTSLGASLSASNSTSNLSNTMKAATANEGKDTGSNDGHHTGSYGASNASNVMPSQVNNPNYMTYGSVRGGPYVMVQQPPGQQMATQYIPAGTQGFYQSVVPNQGHMNGMVASSQGYQANTPQPATSDNMVMLGNQYRGNETLHQDATPSLSSSTSQKRQGHRRTQSANVVLSTGRSPNRMNMQRQVNFLIHTPKHPPPT